MIVCVCNAITENELEKYINDDNSYDINELYDKLGIGNACGTCIEYTKSYLENIKK